MCARALEHEFGMRVTRNAVLGKIWRLGLTGRRAVVRQRTAPPPHEGSVRARLRRPLPSIGAPPQEVVSCPTALFDLRRDQCRWPVGDPRTPEFHFCGARRLEPFPYCDGHARIAYCRDDAREEHPA
jgi:GcrA cell cycle regulator